ncbi:MAG TPA: DHH family phosphoesterase [Longimicrobiales bacterium]|nr:DHH family phosphoesterase [Longimicrobiales bacterium]
MNTRSDNARRVHELRAFARGTQVVPILIQPDPDSDGMASALALRILLHRKEEDSPIISLGEVTRPENQRMAELIGLRVVRVSEPELKGFKRIIAVDTQPEPVESRASYAVIDHHPTRTGYTADLVDIRPDYGAAATIVTEYLRVGDEERITPRLATALIYGIRTDTEVLRRGTAPADVEAYAFLQGRADQELLRKIGRPSFSEGALRSVGRALGELRKQGDVAVAYVGRLDDRASHVLPNLADFCLAIEGVAWSAAAGLVGDELAINIRHVGGGPGAGDLAKALAEEEGMGGGHRSMARVAIRLNGNRPFAEDAGDPEMADWLLGRVAGGVESLRVVR